MIASDTNVCVGGPWHGKKLLLNTAATAIFTVQTGSKRSKQTFHGCYIVSPGQLTWVPKPFTRAIVEQHFDLIG